MNRTAFAIGAALLLALLVGVAVFFGVRSFSPLPEPLPADEPAAHVEPETPGAAPPQPPEPAEEPPRESPVDDDTNPPDEAPEDPDAVEDSATLPEKTRGDWEPVLPEDATEVVPLVVREMAPDMKHCYEQWLLVDPTLEGRLQVGLTLSSEGATDVHIVNAPDVPVGLQTCFASAISEADWPPFEGQTDVVYPFVFTASE